MKKILLAFFALVFVIFVDPVFASEPIYLFYGKGCPHCSKVLDFLEENNLDQIEQKEIYSDRDNAVFFNDLLDQNNIPNNKRAVPTLVDGDKVITGDTPIIDYLSEDASPVTEGKPEEPGTKVNLTLPAVVGASLADAINPCAFAVLIILMSTILGAKQGRKKTLKTGLSFALAIFISYFLMGLGVYSALGSTGLAATFYKAIGWLAIILGLLNLKDYFFYGKGFLMEVPISWRPKLKSIIHSVASPIGAFGVGFLVSLFLLPCTSGPYIVILGMLAKNAFQGQAMLYLLLYNLVFVSPMILITYAVYKGVNPEKAEELRKKHLKTLHLITGLILIGMGIVVFFF